MSRMKMVIGLALATGLAAGCEKKEPEKSPVPKPPAPDVTPTAGARASGQAVLAGETGPASPAAVESAAATASAVTNTPVVAPPATAAVVKAAPEIVAGEPAQSGDNTKQAQDLIAKAIESLKNNKPDEARASIEKVEAMKDPLPKTIYEQLKTVRASLDNVEKIRKTELPALTEGENK